MEVGIDVKTGEILYFILFALPTSCLKEPWFPHLKVGVDQYGFSVPGAEIYNSEQQTVITLRLQFIFTYKVGKTYRFS